MAMFTSVDDESVSGDSEEEPAAAVPVPSVLEDSRAAAVDDAPAASDEGSSGADESEERGEEDEGVSLKERFAALKARRAAVTKRTTSRRTRKLRKQALRAVRECISGPDDARVLEECGVRTEELPPSSNAAEPKSREDALSAKPPRASELEALAPYLDINSRLRPINHGPLATAPSRIDAEISAAIAAGDFDMAERLNARSAQVEAEQRLAEAREAKAYAERVEADERRRLSKRGPKPKWIFEARKKWETKGNM